MPKSKHHLRPKSRGGRDKPSNLLSLEYEKHECWHKLFGNRTLDEVIALLERVRQIKKKTPSGGSL